MTEASSQPTATPEGVRIPLMWGSVPTNRLIWIITDEGEVHEVAYNHEHRFWLGEHAWYRQDGEPGHWMPDEIEGWAETYEDALSLLSMRPALYAIRGGV